MKIHLNDYEASRDEAERPFWISYADLMTALMILFLVVMVVALASIVKKTEDIMEKSLEVEEKTQIENTRLNETLAVCEYLAKKSKATDLADLKVDCRLNRINFGEAGRFATDHYKPPQESAELLSTMVPLILEAAETPLGEKWLKQVIIEGFTDTDGPYLYNLNLSLRRSEFLMCALLGAAPDFKVNLTPEQRLQVKRLFLAGGVAFNDTKQTKDESRRVELKLVFYSLDEQPEKPATYLSKFQDDPTDRCRI